MKNCHTLSLLLMGVTLSVMISSCSIYKQEFDCPPPEGVPCYSETELESMILETKDGCPDLFIPPDNDLKDRTHCGKNPMTPPENSVFNRKVWICDPSQDCGPYMQGYYIYRSKLSDQIDE